MESNITGVKLNLTELATKVNNTEPKANAEEFKNANGSKISVLDNVQETHTLVSTPIADINNASSDKSNEKDKQALLDAIDIVSAFIEPQIRSVNFTQDESSGKTVVKVYDVKSQELIKQFPSEEVLALAEKVKGLQNEIADKTGILIDDKV